MISKALQAAQKNQELLNLINFKSLALGALEADQLQKPFESEKVLQANVWWAWNGCSHSKALAANELQELFSLIIFSSFWIWSTSKAWKTDQIQELLIQLEANKIQKLLKLIGSFKSSSSWSSKLLKLINISGFWNRSTSTQVLGGFESLNCWSDSRELLKLIFKCFWNLSHLLSPCSALLASKVSIRLPLQRLF